MALISVLKRSIEPGSKRRFISRSQEAGPDQSEPDAFALGVAQRQQRRSLSGNNGSRTAASGITPSIFNASLVRVR